MRADTPIGGPTAGPVPATEPADKASTVGSTVFTSDHRLVPPDERSGYREDDDLIHRHYWLGIGAERHIFDPTAHQFDDKGGVSLDRYTINGKSVAASRTP